MRIALNLFIAAGMLVSMTAAAQDGLHEKVDVVETIVAPTITATTYLNGGVGKNEEATMHRLAKEFPLRITFAERKDGEYIADVPVLISDEKGNPVLELSKAGPMLFVMLPDGKYRVSSRFEGLTESQEVTLSGKAGRDVYFHWKGRAKQ